METDAAGRLTVLRCRRILLLRHRMRVYAKSGGQVGETFQAPGKCLALDSIAILDERRSQPPRESFTRAGSRIAVTK